jgi:hypothetical protein
MDQLQGSDAPAALTTLTTPSGSPRTMHMAVDTGCGGPHHPIPPVIMGVQS